MTSTIGIANLGNTCSVATCIQCLYHACSFRDVVLSSNFGSADSLGATFQQIFQMLVENNHQRGTVSISPGAFIKNIAQKSHGLFPYGEQHDLCELLVWLLDQLHEESSTSLPSPPGLSNANALEKIVLKTMHQYQNGKYSTILSHMQGSQMSLVVCNHCGYRVTNVEPFTVITLDLPSSPTSVAKIPEMLKNYLQHEPLDDWKCDRCNNHGAKKTTRFYELPKVLCIVLKRFYMANSQHMVKSNQVVELAQALTFYPNAILSLKSDSNPLHYKLCSIGNHFGSYGGGHYTTIAINNEDWYHIDDTNVEKLEKPDTHSSNAYLLFYELAE